MEATPGFEPGIKALQAHALPLGYVAVKLELWCPEPDLNRHGRNVRGILSPLCLPISPPGHGTLKNRLQKQQDNFREFQVGQTKWSGRRGSNPRPRPWQGRALPLSYSRTTNLKGGIISAKT